MTMIADPTTETFMIGDDGELLGSAWFIDDRDQQRTHIGHIARISDEGEATIKLTEAGTKIMTPPRWRGMPEAGTWASRCHPSNSIGRAS